MALVLLDALLFDRKIHEAYLSPLEVVGGRNNFLVVV